MARVIPRRPAISFPHPAIVSGSGTVSATPDTVPNAFTFVDQSDVAVSSTITSAAITVSGITGASVISVTGGSYDINGSGSFTTSSGTVNNGDTVRVRHTSSALNSTATNTVLTIGGVSDTFTSTTVVASSTNYGGFTPTKYVASTGSDAANGDTEGTAYKTVAFAMSHISPGQVVGVVTDLTENINLTTLSGGTAGNYKRVVGKTAVKIITGSIDGGAANKYIIFQNLHWNIGNVMADFSAATFLKFLVCGFFGGGTSGNTGTHLAGSNQLYESCWFGGNGGRSATTAFECTNVLYRWCVVRTETWGSPADDGNPNSGFQLYSCTNSARIQCVAVDCNPQRSNNETLGGFSVTTNTANSTNIVDQECICTDLDVAGLIGFQVEGSNSVTYQSLDNISVRNLYGLVENLDSAAGSVTINGGEYSLNDADGIARFGVETVNVSNVNTTGNASQNLRGTTNGSGNTTNALNMNTKLSAMKLRGVSETMYGETGYNVQQVSNLFPFPFEDVIRTRFATLGTRGFCGGSFTLSSYLKR